MYSLLFLLFLVIMLWHASYQEGMDPGSACDSMNLQNKTDLDTLTTKVNQAIELTDTIKTMESTLANNTKRIDTVINTQLTALVNGTR
jgi:hypothetical protein